MQTSEWTLPESRCLGPWRRSFAWWFISSSKRNKEQKQLLELESRECMAQRKHCISNRSYQIVSLPFQCKLCHPQACHTYARCVDEACSRPHCPSHLWQQPPYSLSQADSICWGWGSELFYFYAPASLQALLPSAHWRAIVLDGRYQGKIDSFCPAIWDCLQNELWDSNCIIKLTSIRLKVDCFLTNVASLCFRVTVA